MRHVRTHIEYALGMKNSAEAIIIEIRAAEGGDDAKLLVEDQVTIYQRLVANAPGRL